MENTKKIETHTHISFLFLKHISQTLSDQHDIEPHHRMQFRIIFRIPYF